MMKRKIWIGMLVVALGVWTAGLAGAMGEGAGRQRLKMDFGWKFAMGERAGAEAVAFDDKGWRTLDVPHDFSIELPFDRKNASKGAGGFSTLGVGWYRKHFRAPEGSKGKKIFAQFDGVMFKADVWLNGHKVAHNDYGYLGFECDLTPYIIYQGENVLAVRADDSRQFSRWYTGGGIYRHVWLDVTDPVHIKRDGITITADKVTAHEARIIVSTIVRNETKYKENIGLETKVVEPGGKWVGDFLTWRDVPARGQLEIVQEYQAKTPQLWSPESPLLYHVESKIQKTGLTSLITHLPKTIDETATDFGIRTIQFDPDHGFFLNGKKTVMKGICLHHDLGALGAASYETAIEYRLWALKAMGVNALRLSHNPYAPEMLELADRMGFLVFDECYDKWSGVDEAGKNVEFLPDGTGWKETLGAFIDRDRNHPSVVLWSVGNEVPQQNTEKGAALYKAMQDFVHGADPTRPVTAALHPGRAKGGELGPMAGLMDVTSMNYQCKLYEEEHRKHPKMVILGSETLPHVTMNYGAKDPAKKYEAGNSWFYVKDYVCGQFIWAGIDYLGESTGWPSKGWPTCPIDTCGFMKDYGWYQKSLYAAEPVVRVMVDDPGFWRGPKKTGWDWPGMSSSWNWAGRGAKTLTAYVATNGKSVELLLNGKSLGERKVAEEDQNMLEWEVPNEPGTLKAVVKRDGKEVASHEIRTAGAPKKIVLTADRTKLAASGQDLAFVKAEVVDKDGNVVPDRDNIVRFAVSGEGKLAGVDNGDLSDAASYLGNEKETRYGRCLAIVKAGRKAGEIRVKATAEGVEGAEMVIQTEQGKENGSVVE